MYGLDHYFTTMWMYTHTHTWDAKEKQNKKTILKKCHRIKKKVIRVSFTMNTELLICIFSRIGLIVSDVKC